MGLFIASLNSGSNGNCYYIGNHHEAVLIDAGISCRETERRMKRLGLSLQKVKAIFISHEHSDHVNGVETLSRKYNLPVYITPQTLQGSRLVLDEINVCSFQAHEPISIGKLNIFAFTKLHDAAHPHSFVVEHQDIKVGVFTDIGSVCNQVKAHFSQCHAAFLEANYDAELLEKGHYPYHLKQRIRGGHGHLSNHQALELFITHRPSYMSHLLLAHLSKDNNNPDLVYQLFNQHRNDTNIIVASRHEETAVYYIDGVSKPAADMQLGQMQYSLF